MGVTEIKHRGTNLTIEFDPDPTDPNHPLSILITCPIGGKLIVLDKGKFDAVGNYYPYKGQCRGCQTRNIHPIGIKNELKIPNSDLTAKLVVITFLTTQDEYCNDPDNENLQPV